MDRHFRLPPSNKCVFQGCHHPVPKDTEIQMPFDGQTLLLTLCETCIDNLPTNMKFQSFSSNGYRYVEEIYPAEGVSHVR